MKGGKKKLNHNTIILIQHIVLPFVTCLPNSVLWNVIAVEGGLVAKRCLTLAISWTLAHQTPLSLGFSSLLYCHFLLHVTADKTFYKSKDDSVGRSTGGTEEYVSVLGRSSASSMMEVFPLVILLRNPDTLWPQHLSPLLAARCQHC